MAQITLKQPAQIKIKEKLAATQPNITQQKELRHIKSQPQLKVIQQGQEAKQKRSIHLPHFIRSIKSPFQRKKASIKFNYQSPPSKNNPLVHQPVKKPTEEGSPSHKFKRQVIPPSDINHDKMKNFSQNPERFFLNLDEGLQKVFKKSIQSIIRTAEKVPVKDWQIRQSTNLLDGFEEQK